VPRGNLPTRLRDAGAPDGALPALYQQAWRQDVTLAHWSSPTPLPPGPHLHAALHRACQKLGATHCFPHIPRQLPASFLSRAHTSPSQPPPTFGTGGTDLAHLTTAPGCRHTLTTSPHLLFLKTQKNGGTQGCPHLDSANMRSGDHMHAVGLAQNRGRPRKPLPTTVHLALHGWLPAP